MKNLYYIVMGSQLLWIFATWLSGTHELMFPFLLLTKTGIILACYGMLTVAREMENMSSKSLDDIKSQALLDKIQVAAPRPLTNPA